MEAKIPGAEAIEDSRPEKHQPHTETCSAIASAGIQENSRPTVNGPVLQYERFESHRALSL